MNNKDLVNRFELLYPDNTNISDLRRSYTDRDFSSIFRLLGSEHDELRKAVVEQNLNSIFRLVGSDHDELRKAVIEKNLNSIFRLVGSDHDELRKAVIEKNLNSIFRLVGSDHDELRKFILEDNTWSLWKLLEKYVSTNFVASLKTLARLEIEFNQDCLSQGQILSKRWLIQELRNLDINLGTVFLCAGWYATLATMLFESGINIDKIRSFDVDPSCSSIAETFNKPWVMEGWKFKAATQNILDVNYSSHAYKVLKSNGESQDLIDAPDTIINTSCEHITDFEKWYNGIPHGKLVILQTNNYFEIEDHVNCSKNLKAFKKQAPMSTELYSGQLELEKYTRYMRIGYR